MIHYYDIGDYLKREAKLNLLAGFENLDSVPFEKITPNNKGDWINQREDAFDKLIALKRDKKLQNPSVFDINSIMIEKSPPIKRKSHGFKILKRN